jgi:hypothetical protein
MRLGLLGPVRIGAFHAETLAGLSLRSTARFGSRKSGSPDR